MKKALLLSILCLSSFLAFSQESDTTIYQIVEQSASPQGGIAGLYEYIGNNLKYPQSAILKKTEGKVFMSFVVEKNGSVSNVNIIRDIGEGCGTEAQRVILNCPNWSPALQNGKPVRQKMTLPITFKLQDGDTTVVSKGVEPKTVEVEPEIIEISASPKGGMMTFYGYIANNLKYPKLARKQKIEGKVFVSFVVGKDGGFTDITILRGIGGGCEEEAIRLIQEAEKWNPCTQNGKPVRQKMTLPVTFKLK